MFFRMLLVLICMLLIGGCGNYQLIEDRSDHYMESELGPAMVVPEWYSDRRLKDRYPVPQADKSFVEVSEFVVPEPPETGSGILQEPFVLKTVKEDTWLLANEPPGKIWPALKAYWEFYGGNIEEQDTSAGQMGVVFRSTSAKGRDFMQKHGLLKLGPVASLEVTVDQGLKRSSSEIRLNRIAGVEAGQATEEKFLTDIREFLSNRTASFESYSLAAQNIGSGDKLTLVDKDDRPYLKVDLQFERAWYAVGEALARSHIPIIDWNRKEGLYYVSFEEDSQEEGWLPNLFSINGSGQNADSFNFIIELNTNTDGVHVDSVPVEGSADDQDRIRLLNQLLDHMS